MLKLYRDNKDQPELWESFLPPALKQIPEELALVDEALGDKKFVSRFEKKLLVKLQEEEISSHLGRPTIPLATYIRLMYLKFRYQLGYETLLKEVSDSIQWRRFCDLSLYQEVPDDTTLIKLTNRFGQELIDELNHALICKVKERKLIKGKKMRIDTTVISSNIHYPTQSTLLGDGVRVITRTIKKIEKKLNNKIKFTNRLRTIRKTLLNLTKFVRGKTSSLKKKLQQKVLSVTEEVLKEAKNVQKFLKRSFSLKKRISPAITSLKGKLKEAISLTEIVANQTKQVFRGNYHLPKRIVSIFDSQARPIIKGKVSPKTEFGRTVLIQEAEVPLITNYKVFEGVPGDAAQVIPAVKKHRKIFGRSPKEIAGDRGCYNKEHENLLHRLGVKHVSIPARGNRDPTCKEKEHTFWFKQLQRWRAGSEALISLLKRKFGLSRSLFRGTPGTATWVGYTVFAYNLWEMAKLNSS